MLLLFFYASHGIKCQRVTKGFSNSSSNDFNDRCKAKAPCSIMKIYPTCTLIICANFTDKPDCSRCQHRGSNINVNAYGTLC